MPEEDHFHIPNKYNFDVTFERDNFMGEIRVPKNTASRSGCERKVMKSKIHIGTIQKGNFRPRINFKQNLNIKSRPDYWFQAFYPGRTNSYDIFYKYLSISIWAVFLNMIAYLNNIFQTPNQPLILSHQESLKKIFHSI